MKQPFARVAAMALALLAVAPASPAPWRVSEDQRHFVNADGEPTLYLADTAWELFHRLDREATTHYLEDRAAKGFSVIQAVVLAERDGLRIPNRYGDLPLIELDPSRPNESYFKHVDFVVAEAERLGLQMAILPTWGDKVKSASRGGAGPVVFNPANAEAFGAYLGARYRGRDVIWVAGGDRDVDSDEAYLVWTALARGLRSGGGGEHLISFHPVGDGSSADHFHDEEWLDFNMYQSGHSNRYTAVHAFAERHLLLQPRKPFVDGEPPYEDIAIRFWERMDWSKYPSGVPAQLHDRGNADAVRRFFQDAFFTDHDVRVHAYWNLLSGAAGYAYGHNAVWQMREYGEEPAIPTLMDWREALDRPGAQDMRHLRDLFESRPFGRLLPDQSMIFGQNPIGPDHVRCAAAADGSFAFVYLSRGQGVRVRLSGFAGKKVMAWWFNPRDGTVRSVGHFAAGSLQAFVPPTSGDGNDWLLVLDQESAFENPPGAAATP